MIKLFNLRKNDKFKWNGKIYTIYAREGDMTEVFGDGKWWAWPNNATVEKVEHKQ